MLSVRNLKKIKQRQEERATLLLVSAPSDAPAASRVGSRPHIFHAAPSAAPVAAPVVPAWECPSPSEICAGLYELIFVSFREAGVYDLIIVAAIAYVAVYTLHEMIKWLQAVFSLSLPTTKTLASAVFDYADRQPMTFLLLDFIIAFVIGMAFLYQAEINEAWESLQHSLRRWQAAPATMRSRRETQQVQRGKPALPAAWLPPTRALPLPLARRP
jgi:hypothetical protein